MTGPVHRLTVHGWRNLYTKVQQLHVVPTEAAGAHAFDALQAENDDNPAADECRCV